MTTCSGKPYQSPSAVAAVELTTTANASQDTSVAVSDNRTGTLNNPELSELTSLPEETTEPPVEDSVASAGAGPITC